MVHLSAAWLALGGTLYTLRLSPGGFPKPLTPEEEAHYLTLSAQGDQEARNMLIERNLRLVAHIMKKYYANESDQEDLISIGTIGLIKAISTYRMDKNIRLATYASRCIENVETTLRNLFLDGTDGGRLSGAQKMFASWDEGKTDIQNMPFSMTTAFDWWLPESSWMRIASWPGITAMGTYPMCLTGSGGFGIPKG